MSMGCGGAGLVDSGLGPLESTTIVAYFHGLVAKGNTVMIP